MSWPSEQEDFMSLCNFVLISLGSFQLLELSSGVETQLQDV